MMIHGNPNPDPSPAASFFCASSAEPLGKGVRGERLYFAVRHDFIVPLKKLGIMSDDFIAPNLD